MSRCTLEIEIPEKYAEKLESVEEVEPGAREQIEIEVMPNVLRIIADTHRRIEAQQEQAGGGVVKQATPGEEIGDLEDPENPEAETEADD